MRAEGQRCFNSAVLFPGPQPKSAMVATSSRGILASSSADAFFLRQIAGKEKGSSRPFQFSVLHASARIAQADA
jgi:hypothetical protein